MNTPDNNENSRHQKQRELLLDVVERMYNNYNFRAVTMVDIAKDANMSSSNIYRYFEDKDELTRALLVREMERVERVCSSLVETKEVASKRLAVFLMKWHEMTIERKLSARGLHELMCFALNENWNVFESHNTHMRGMIWDLILSGVHNCEFNVNNVDCAARMVFYSVSAFTDPRQACVLFANDKDFRQMREMNRFVIGTLSSGCM